MKNRSTVDMSLSVGCITGLTAELEVTRTGMQARAR